jgi:hypothetical protein
MDDSPRFLPLAARTIVCHTITYFIMGILAAHFLNYAAVMSRPDSGMRQFSDPWVMAGPLFQPVRGLVFALVSLSAARAPVRQNERLAADGVAADRSRHPVHIRCGLRID